MVGGGSGGHVLPNLAIASALKSKADILYVGSRSPLDRNLVAASGLPFKAIFTGKLRRYFSWRNFTDPFLVLAGFFQSLWLMFSFRPQVVFTKGGFVSIPIAFAAFLTGRPIVLHESDSVMGLSNRIVARLAKKVCVAFPSALASGSHTILTGNPVRSSILTGSVDVGYCLTGFRADKPVVLVWGGSQGAEEINRLIEESFSRLKSHFQIIHITGQDKGTSLVDPSYCQFDYLEDELRHVYAITDLVVGRSGANSLAEIALMEKPAVLIPLKSAAHDHQRLNAEYFEKEGASLVLREESLYDLLLALWKNPAQMSTMKTSLARLARPKAAEEIGEILNRIKD